MSRRFYILLPGILTDPADWRNWAPRAATAINLRPDATKADEFRYYARALTPKRRQTERAEYVINVALRAFHNGYQPVLVGHSNGCEVIRQALASMPTVIHSVHLIAGATEADWDKGGWTRALDEGTVGHIFVYQSTRDGVLRWAASAGAWLGYGRLGYLGPQRVHARHLVPGRERVTTIRRDYTHGEWFEGRAFDQTLAAITVAERMHE